MPVRCYGQSWYKYQIRIGVCALICRDLSWTEGISPTRIRMDQSPPVNNTRRTKPNNWVETLLALEICIDKAEKAFRSTLQETKKESKKIS